MTDVLHIDPKEPGADIKMMKTPDAWFHRHVLAVKRKLPADLDMSEVPSSDLMCFGPDSEMGLMFLVPGIERWAVVRMNLLDTRIRPLLFGGGPPPENVTIYIYADAEEVFDAGWRVD